MKRRRTLQFEMMNNLKEDGNFKEGTETEEEGIFLYFNFKHINVTKKAKIIEK